MISCPSLVVDAKHVADGEYMLSLNGATDRQAYSAVCRSTLALLPYIELTIIAPGSTGAAVTAPKGATMCAGSLVCAIGAVPGTPADAPATLSWLPGWNPGAVGFHSDDGCLFLGHAHAPPASTAPAWHNAGSTAGFGVLPSSNKPSDKEFVFTLNGALVWKQAVPPGFRAEEMLPCVGAVGDRMVLRWRVKGPFKYAPANEHAPQAVKPKAAAAMSNLAAAGGGGAALLPPTACMAALATDEDPASSNSTAGIGGGGSDKNANGVRGDAAAGVSTAITED